MAPAGAGMPVKKLPAQAGRFGSSICTLKRASRSAAQIANTIAAIQPRLPSALQSPEIKDQARRDAEIDEVREAVELGAEARRALDHARDAPVDRIEHRGEHDRAERQLVAPLEREADAGQPGAQREQRDHVRHEHAHRNLAQPLSRRWCRSGSNCEYGMERNIAVYALPRHPAQCRG